MKIPLHTRRDFLARGLGLIAVTPTIPTFLAQTLRALALPDPTIPVLTDKDGRILVVIQLSGGNDGLNTIVPFGHTAYYKARPSIGIAPDKVLKINDEIGFHPSLAPFKNLYDEGKLGIIQGVGYPNPDRSHFRSMEIWQSGIVDHFETTGWIGRMFDHTCANAHLQHPSPTLSVSVGETLNPSQRGSSSIGVALRNPEQFFRMTQVASKLVPEREDSTASTAVRSQMDFLRRTAMNAELSANRIRHSVRAIQNAISYPKDPFSQGLKLISAMIAGGMDTQVYYISLSGFDTHARQLGTHERLLKILAEGIGAFQKDLEALGQADRVVGFTFSEFGRRVAENGSKGTDHGQAAPMFTFGRAIQPGIVGTHPSLEKLTQGDVTHSIDFRQIYSTMITDWMKVGDASSILGASFKNLPLIRTI